MREYYLEFFFGLSLLVLFISLYLIIRMGNQNAGGNSESKRISREGKNKGSTSNSLYKKI